MYLSSIALDNVGPSGHIELALARRLNIITGDNGLGKTFLLDCMWWSLTGRWRGRPARPRDIEQPAAISYCLAHSSSDELVEPVRAEYVRRRASWDRPCAGQQDDSTSLCVYACVDGSYAIWDTSRYYTDYDQRVTVLSDDDIWSGRTGCTEGIIRDWVKWQSLPDRYPFEVFKKVLSVLSPPDLGELVPGLPMRILGDARDIPTIVFPYATVPITEVSVGIRRVISLAYIIVWAWNEHKSASENLGVRPASRAVIMVDEVEAHLHPKWQRTLLPALMQIQRFLSDELETQLVVSTHSPLVMASVETQFDRDADKLFHVELSVDGRDTVVTEQDFIVYGQVNSWLTSPIFNLDYARSKEAADAIERATRLEMSDHPDEGEIAEVDAELVRCLAERDPFWHRWVYFAEQHGVKI